MKSKILLLLQFIAFELIISNTYSCKKDNKKEDPIIKKEVLINWSNPSNIDAGIALSNTQLNATANVSGTFVYTPTIGAILNLGDSQNLKVDFIPTDAAHYNNATKTVTINVTNTFTDSRDGNVYHKITIGTQVWMIENLRYLPSVVGPIVGSDAIPYYYVYGYSGTNVSEAKAQSNYTTYGVLYNWQAAMNGEASSDANPSGVQGVCPTGWHLPSNAEWSQLTSYLGGDSLAGGKLKEIGTVHWASPNNDATNESGFTGLPGGFRNNDGTFWLMASAGNWWSSKEYDTDIAWFRHLSFYNSNIMTYYGNKAGGYYVRCIKD